jgi:predicted ester cyclase
MSRHFAGFPDLRVTIDAVVAEGNSVGIWYSAQGTHQGIFESISPTGKQLKWGGVDLLTFQRNKVSGAIFFSELPARLIEAAK